MCFERGRLWNLRGFGSCTGNLPNAAQCSAPTANLQRVKVSWELLEKCQLLTASSAYWSHCNSLSTTPLSAAHYWDDLQMRCCFCNSGWLEGLLLNLMDTVERSRSHEQWPFWRTARLLQLVWLSHTFLWSLSLIVFAVIYCDLCEFSPWLCSPCWQVYKARSLKVTSSVRQWEMCCSYSTSVIH